MTITQWCERVACALAEAGYPDAVIWFDAYFEEVAADLVLIDHEVTGATYSCVHDQEDPPRVPQEVLDKAISLVGDPPPFISCDPAR